MAMMWLVARRMRQAELPIRSTVTDESLEEVDSSSDDNSDDESVDDSDDDDDDDSS